MTERVEDGGPVVTVKPLEWTASKVPNLEEATSILGTYRVWNYGIAGYWSPGSVGGTRASGGRSGAKAAAQADYERRILSALVITTPQPSGNSGEFAPARQMGLDVGGAE